MAWFGLFHVGFNFKKKASMGSLWWKRLFSMLFSTSFRHQFWLRRYLEIFEGYMLIFYFFYTLKNVFNLKIWWTVGWRNISQFFLKGEKVIMSNRPKSSFFLERGLGLGYFMLVSAWKIKALMGSLWWKSLFSMLFSTSFRD